MKNIDKLKKEFAEMDANDIVSMFETDCSRCASDVKTCETNCREGNIRWLSQNTKPDCKIVTWSGGTIKEIRDMINAARDGKIDLSDYWHIGDKRTFGLSEHTEVTLVLVDRNPGEYEFAVAFEDCQFMARMNQLNINKGGYDSSRAKQLIDDYYETWKYRDVLSSLDGLRLPTEYQVFGENIYSDAEEGQRQFEYYKDEENRVKQFEGIDMWWWLASPYSGNSASFCFVNTGGSASNGYAGTSFGIAPFGCII